MKRTFWALSALVLLFIAAYLVSLSLRIRKQSVRDEARTRFEEIAEGLSGISPDSPFWASVQVSRLCLVVSGWSFFYTLDEETLRVTEARVRK